MARDKELSAVIAVTQNTDGNYFEPLDESIGGDRIEIKIDAYADEAEPR
jgi:hypothetical protein